jgi:hypothetical protein
MSHHHPNHYGISSFYPEDGGSMWFCNVDVSQQHCKVSELKDAI